MKALNVWKTQTPDLERGWEISFCCTQLARPEQQPLLPSTFAGGHFTGWTSSPLSQGWWLFTFFVCLTAIAVHTKKKKEKKACFYKSKKQVWLLPSGWDFSQGQHSEGLVLSWKFKTVLFRGNRGFSSWFLVKGTLQTMGESSPKAVVWHQPQKLPASWSMSPSELIQEELRWYFPEVWSFAFSFLLRTQLQSHLPIPSALSYPRQICNTAKCEHWIIGLVPSQHLVVKSMLASFFDLRLFLACDCINLKGKPVVFFWDTKEKEAPLVQTQKAISSTCYSYLCLWRV